MELLAWLVLADKRMSLLNLFFMVVKVTCGYCPRACNETKMLLFDEPTSALDPEMAGDVLGSNAKPS